MKATGLIEGNLSLPDMQFIDDSFSEIMIPTGENEMVSYVRARFRAADGTEIPVKMVGRYSPLAEDGQWGCSKQVIERQRYQMRTSFLSNLEAKESALALNYTTVVMGISTPIISAEQVHRLAALS